MNELKTDDPTSVNIPKSPWAATLARASVKTNPNHLIQPNEINETKTTTTTQMPSKLAAITSPPPPPPPPAPSAQTSNLPSATTKTSSIPTITTQSISGVGGDDARLRAEAVKKNWKIVLDMAMKTKRNDGGDYFDRSESIALNMSAFGGGTATREIYASEKENWIYFSIIIATVVFLSILFCYLVYSFFPSFRAHNF